MPHGTQTDAMTAPQREAAVAARAQRMLPATLASFMSAFITAVVTAINTGIDADFALRWAKAWSITLPTAIVAVYTFRPLAVKCARSIASLMTTRVGE
jgi:hypothetical protein